MTCDLFSIDESGKIPKTVSKVPLTISLSFTVLPRTQSYYCIPFVHSLTQDPFQVEYPLNYETLSM